MKGTELSAITGSPLDAGLGATESIPVLPVVMVSVQRVRQRRTGSSGIKM